MGIFDQIKPKIGSLTIGFDGIFQLLADKIELLEQKTSDANFELTDRICVLEQRADAPVNIVANKTTNVYEMGKVKVDTITVEHEEQRRSSVGSSSLNSQKLNTEDGEASTNNDADKPIVAAGDIPFSARSKQSIFGNTRSSAGTPTSLTSRIGNLEKLMQETRDRLLKQERQVEISERQIQQITESANSLEDRLFRELENMQQQLKHTDYDIKRLGATVEKGNDNSGEIESSPILPNSSNMFSLPRFENTSSRSSRSGIKNRRASSSGYFESNNSSIEINNNSQQIDELKEAVANLEAELQKQKSETGRLMNNLEDLEVDQKVLKEKSKQRPAPKRKSIDMGNQWRITTEGQLEKFNITLKDLKNQVNILSNNNGPAHTSFFTSKDIKSLINIALPVLPSSEESSNGQSTEDYDHHISEVLKNLLTPCLARLARGLRNASDSARERMPLKVFQFIRALMGDCKALEGVSMDSVQATNRIPPLLNELEEFTDVHKTGSVDKEGHEVLSGLLFEAETGSVPFMDGIKECVATLEKVQMLLSIHPIAKSRIDAITQGLQLKANKATVDRLRVSLQRCEDALNERDNTQESMDSLKQNIASTAKVANHLRREVTSLVDESNSQQRQSSRLRTDVASIQDELKRFRDGLTLLASQEQLDSALESVTNRIQKSVDEKASRQQLDGIKSELRSKVDNKDLAKVKHQMQNAVSSAHDFGSLDIGAGAAKQKLLCLSCSHPVKMAEPPHIPDGPLSNRDKQIRVEMVSSLPRNFKRIKESFQRLSPAISPQNRNQYISAVQKRDLLTKSGEPLEEASRPWSSHTPGGTESRHRKKRPDTSHQAKNAHKTLTSSYSRIMPRNASYHSQSQPILHH